MKLSKKAGFESTLNDNRNLRQSEPNYVTSFKCFVENMIRRDHVFGADFESHNWKHDLTSTRAGATLIFGKGGCTKSDELSEKFQ